MKPSAFRPHALYETSLFAHFRAQPPAFAKTWWMCHPRDRCGRIRTRRAISFFEMSTPWPAQQAAGRGMALALPGPPPGLGAHGRCAVAGYHDGATVTVEDHRSDDSRYRD